MNQKKLKIARKNGFIFKQINQLTEKIFVVRQIKIYVVI